MKNFNVILDEYCKNKYVNTGFRDVKIQKEAEKNAKDLAEILYEDITDEADDMCVDRKWYFDKVIQYMRKESEDI